MSTLNRLARLGAFVMLGAAMTGCCVLPPYRWHGERGHGGYYQGGPTPGYGGPSDGYRQPGPNR